MTSHGAARSILFWAFAAAFVLAGCGGSSGGESATTTAAATTAPSSAGGGGGKNGRLSQAQWAEYSAVLANAQKVNRPAIATFSRCRRLIASNQNPEQVSACLGKSTSAVVTTGKQTLTELEKVTAGTSGACAKAGQQLTGNVKLYVATVQSIQTTVSQGKAPTTQSIDMALSQLGRARASNAAFEAACKPAGAA
jgi:hypothetical protein